MDDGTAEALGRRLVACEGFRDMPGMRWVGQCGAWRSVDRVDEEAMAYGDVNANWWDPELVADERWPDLRDPATRGCVLALVREAHGVPSLQCGHEGGWDPGWDSWTVTNPPGRGHGCCIKSRQCATEAEALVVALEKANDA